MIRVYSLYLPISGKFRVDSWLYHSIFLAGTCPDLYHCHVGSPKFEREGILCFFVFEIMVWALKERQISKIHSAIFNSYVSHYQRVYPINIPLFPIKIPWNPISALNTCSKVLWKNLGNPRMLFFNLDGRWDFPAEVHLGLEGCKNFFTSDEADW